MLKRNIENHVCFSDNYKEDNTNKHAYDFDTTLQKEVIT